ncbi:MAG TPA: hypothetical protein VNY73_11140, partial [Bacteroidia bacterium]|nr:hypothetical protein [Bacteroidia bacterium]
MGKKIAFIALLTIALVCGTWGYFYLQQLKKPTHKPLQVLPGNCYAIAEVKEPKDFIAQLTRGNLMWEEFLRISDVKKFSETLLWLDSLTDAGDVKDVLGKEPLFIAFYGNEIKNSVAYAFNLSDVNETQNAIGFFEKSFSAKKRQENIYGCVLNTGNEKTPFFLYIESGLVVVSSNDSLLNVIAEKTNKQTLYENKNFTAAYTTTAKDKGLSIYVHFPVFYAQARNRFFSAKMTNEFLADKTERWFPFDVGIEPSEISAKGFLPNDSTVLYKVFKNQEPDNFKNLFSCLPYHTALLEAVNISDYGTFVRDNYSGNIEQRHTDLKIYSDSLSADAQTEITKFAGNYTAVFEAAYNDTIFQYGLMSVSDNEKAFAFIKNTCDSVYAKNDIADIFYSRDGNLFKYLSALFFKHTFKFTCVYNDCILFCNSVKGINACIKSGGSKNNFSVNERAMSFIKENFNTDLNYLFYTDVFKAKEKLQAELSATINKSLDEAPELYEKFDAMAFSLQKVKETILFNARAGFNPKYKMYQNTLWETLLDTDLYKLPKPVINHKTGENELVCQDMNNNLYLISNTGKILWKKNLHEKIQGDILQIDYFANGRLQLLFVTENSIHVIDRNGNYIKDFPVKIKAGAADGISLFSYDNSKNYRLWIPLKNNTVCCLNASCKLVDGFVPLVVKAPLNRPIKQLIIQQKDYFVLTDTAGNVYVVNRKGEERIKISAKLPPGTYPLYFDIGKDVSRTYLCYVDVKTKTFCKLSLDDKLEKIELKPENKPEGFFFDTLQQNKAPLLVLISEDHYESFDLFGNKTGEIKTSRDIQPTANCLNFSGRVIYASL